MKRLQKLKEESGQVIIVAALCMTCILGFVGFAADIGTLTHAKREMQTAADAGAMAGAAEYSYGGASAAAKAATALNGFTDTVNGVTITVHTPPSYGAYAGKSSYVEVIVQQHQPTLFMQLFNPNKINVGARAVAYNGATNTNCIYVLDPSADDAMDMQGSFTVTAPNCGVVVDSSSSSALNFTGGGGTLTAGSIGVVGGDSGKTGDASPTPVTGIAATSDPLASSVSFPTPTGCTAGGTLTGTIGPTTAGGTICYSGSVTLNNVTMNAGTYIFTGNVTMSGAVSSATTGTYTGTTIDMAGGALTVNTGTNLNLTAPTTGTCSVCAYNGLVLMQPSTDTNTIQLQKGSSYGSLTGIVYAPTAQFYMQDSGGDKNGGIALTTDLVVGTLFDKTATLSLTSYSLTHATSPLVRVALVE